MYSDQMISSHSQQDTVTFILILLVSNTLAAATDSCILE